jgi:ABC-type sugar transport system ATPase subunit
MNVLGGNLAPDAGEMLLLDRPYHPRKPADAALAGIAFIHQELNLFPNLSIAENLFLTAFPRTAAGTIRRRALRQKAADLLREAGLDLDPEMKVERLSAGQRQQVEIAKAIGQDARLIIFDEPTTSLSTREKENLFALIARLRARSVSMLYISHTLGDVLALCDDIAVLRDGELVGRGPSKDFDVTGLVSLMVGRTLQQLYPVRAGRSTGESLLEARQLSQPGVIRNVSFTLHAGEVLGISGLMGAGRSEMARILFGLDPSRGSIAMRGEKVEGGPAARIRQGLAFLTESRHEEGLCLEASIAENLALVALPGFRKTGSPFLRVGALGEALARVRQAVRLSPGAGDHQPVRTLSGGNQQKVVLGKWLLSSPKVLILDEPTRGIDVGARFEIYQLIHQLADGGAGVLVISSELEELLGICDRLLVMRHGEVVDEVSREEFERERILRAALGA